MQYFQTLELTPAYVGPIIPAPLAFRVTGTTPWDFSNDSNQDNRDGFLSPGTGGL